MTENNSFCWEVTTVPKVDITSALFDTHCKFHVLNTIMLGMKEDLWIIIGFVWELASNNKH